MTKTITYSLYYRPRKQARNLEALPYQGQIIYKTEQAAKDAAEEELLDIGEYWDISVVQNKE